MEIENAWQEILKLLEDNQVDCLAPRYAVLVGNIAVSILRVVGRKVSRDTAPGISKAVMKPASRATWRK